jgi:choline dehydrogenase
VLPGPSVQTHDQIAEFVRQQAWGHHACGTCRIGPRGDPMAVVDSGFRVRGVANLRVVDASVFPRIPGFFIVTPIYMLSEKASDVILADARKAGRRAWPTTST